MDTGEFQKLIRTYHRKHKRDLPWRRTRDPYKILVSEIMLQQTQVSRVLPKYESFVKKFPTVRDLAEAGLADVLREWQGLGYNRRAISLKRCAETIQKDFAGEFPRNFKTLLSLPGIGPATAGDLMAFAWNMPVPVIETNIRSVFIHCFFEGKQKVSDKDIMPLVENTLDRDNPREWYYALFDYGTHLKKTSNPSRRSAHHLKQPPFAGSFRQKRANVLRAILERPRTRKELEAALGYEPKATARILAALKKEGFIVKTKSGRYTAA